MLSFQPGGKPSTFISLTRELIEKCLVIFYTTTWPVYKVEDGEVRLGEL